MIRVQYFAGVVAVAMLDVSCCLGPPKTVFIEINNIFLINLNILAKFY